MEDPHADIFIRAYTNWSRLFAYNKLFNGTAVWTVYTSRLVGKWPGKTMYEFTRKDYFGSL